MSLKRKVHILCVVSMHRAQSKKIMCHVKRGELYKQDFCLCFVSILPCKNNTLLFRWNK